MSSFTPQTERQRDDPHTCLASIMDCSLLVIWASQEWIPCIKPIRARYSTQQCLGFQFKLKRTKAEEIQQALIYSKAQSILTQSKYIYVCAHIHKRLSPLETGARHCFVLICSCWPADPWADKSGLLTHLHARPHTLLPRTMHYCWHSTFNYAAVSHCPSPQIHFNKLSLSLVFSTSPSLKVTAKGVTFSANP